MTGTSRSMTVRIVLLVGAAIGTLSTGAALWFTDRTQANGSHARDEAVCGSRESVSFMSYAVHGNCAQEPTGGVDLGQQECMTVSRVGAILNDQTCRFHEIDLSGVSESLPPHSGVPLVLRNSNGVAAVAVGVFRRQESNEVFFQVLEPHLSPRVMSAEELVKLGFASVIAYERRENCGVGISSDGRVQCDTVWKSLGLIKHFSDATSVFQIHNGSDSPVFVEVSATSCGCTSVALPDRGEVLPGCTARILVNTESGIARRISQYADLTVVNQDTGERSALRLHVFANQPRYPRVSPEVLDFGQIGYDRRSAGVLLTVSDARLEVLECKVTEATIDESARGLAVDAVPQRSRPDEVSLRLTLRAEGATAGLKRGMIRIRTSDRDVPEIRVPYLCSVVSSRPPQE